MYFRFWGGGVNDIDAHVRSGRFWNDNIGPIQTNLLIKSECFRTIVKEKESVRLPFVTWMCRNPENVDGETVLEFGTAGRLRF